MEYIAVIVFFVAILWLWARSSPEKERSMTKSERTFLDNKEWLEQRWATINADANNLVEAWYFDEPTELQFNRLAEDGLSISDKALTKGQVSDLIGLFVKPDDHEKEILKFFKIPLKGFNQTQARHQIAVLLQDNEKKKQWEDRPASAIDKEFYRFIGKPVPKTLTHTQAMKDQADTELSDELEDEWDNYCSVWDELSDKDVREDYEIKKPSLAKLRQAWAAAKAEVEDNDDLSDVGLIADKLLELFPELER